MKFETSGYIRHFGKGNIRRLTGHIHHLPNVPQKMVRNYKKKTNRVNINEIAIQKAISDVRHGRETLASASLKHGIKRTTLQSRIKKRDPLRNSSDSETEGGIFQSKYTSRQILTKDQEKDLGEYVKKCAFYQHGLTYHTFKKFVYEFVILNGIPHPEKWDGCKEASEDWLSGFLKRNKTLSLRKPERISLARVKGLNKTAVNIFYDNLKKLYQQNSFEPKDIYNLDESGITTVLETPKVLAQRGQRSVCQISSAERGVLVTVVGVVSAIGNHLPPIYVFPRQRYTDRFMDGCLAGSLGLVSKSGWMISELFVDVLKHVKRYTNCSKDLPILLLLDNHSSHCSLESINFCRDNGIYLLSFPPHTSHRLQPLDVSVFGPFKKFCRTSFNDFLCANEGKQISIYNIAKLTNQPFLRAFSSENICSGFRTTGIYPLNCQVFQEEEFSLEMVTIETDGNVTTTQSLSPEQIQPIQLPSIQTPEMIRPIQRLLAAKNTSRSGSSRILTSSTEKHRAEENEAKKNSKQIQKDKKQIEAVKRVVQFPSKRMQQEQQNKNKKGPSQKKKQMEAASSDESDTEIQYAESDQSDGAFIEDSSCSDTEATHFSKNNLADEDHLTVGDYVLVKLNGNLKKQTFYVGEIIEKFSDSTFNINFLRRSDTSSWVFMEPLNKDVSLTLKSEIELKLPRPSNPASTSRSRARFCFNINLTHYYVK